MGDLQITWGSRWEDNSHENWLYKQSVLSVSTSWPTVQLPLSLCMSKS